MATACDNIPKFGCGDSKEYSYIPNEINKITHSKKNKYYLDNINYPLYSRTRYFSINKNDSKNRGGSYYLNGTSCWKELGAENEPCLCLNTDGDTSTGSVTESFETVDSTIYFLDIVNNIKFFKIDTQQITFSKSSNSLAAFREPWGTGYYIKFKITSALVTKKTEYKLIVNQEDITIYTEAEQYNPYSDEAPLILLYPNPPSLATPLDEDILKYGFYDYNAGGPGGDWAGLATSDGGKDFYYPEWNRNLGINNDVDKEIRDIRFTQLLDTDKQTYDTTLALSWDKEVFPIFSAAVDKFKNIFVSCIIENKLTYNKIFTSDGLQLSPEQFCDKIPLGTNSLFMPISII